ncbi:MAG TPA: arginine repressor [Planctomycetota bacterium]|nr:arginine repressor [Planctomycetota bacterium]
MAPLPLEERDGRREAVKRLLGERAIRSQAELAEALGQLGFEITQSSLSRDLRELRAAKVEGRYVLPDAVMRIDGVGRNAEAALDEAAAFMLDVAAAGPHLLVVRTTAGGAQPTALAVDEAALPGVVGTVAGDDTLFVALKGPADRRRIETRLRAALDRARKERSDA